MLTRYNLVPLRLAIELTRTLFHAFIHRLPIGLFLVTAVFRMILSTLQPRQIQHLSEPTRTSYASWMKQKQPLLARSGKHELASLCSVDIETLDADDGSALLWLGNRQTAKRIIFFLHGGGYLVPLNPAHMEWCWQAFIKAGADSGAETAVAILEYTLCPGAAFPAQLRQAASGLSRILSTGAKPRDVMLGGDSAGGNLTMQLLHHLIHPYPHIPAIKLSKPLKGAFMASPWLSVKTEGASYRANHGIDMLTASIVQNSIRGVLGGKAAATAGRAERDGAFPFDMDDVSFLESLPEIISRLYVSAGQYEVLRDQIVAFTVEVQKRAPKMDVKLDLFDKQAHDFVLLEGLVKKRGKATQAMIEWLK